MANGRGCAAAMHDVRRGEAGLLVMDGHAIFATVEALCSFGARWMGSQSVDRVKRFLSQEMAAIGLSLTRQKFRFRNYSLEEATLRVLDASGKTREIVCEPVACSRPLRMPLEAQLIQGSVAGVASAALSGRVHCLRSTNPLEGYAQAMKQGAAAAILATDLSGHAIRCAVCTGDGSQGGIPAVSIAGHDAHALFQQLERGHPLWAVLDVRGGMRSMAGENLLFTMPGAITPPVVVFSQYDSFWNGVHAKDSAAGMAVQLHVARELSWEADWDRCRETLFCYGGAQTLAPWGATACRDTLLQQGRTPAAVLEVGALGGQGTGLTVTASESLMPMAKEAAETAGVDISRWSVMPPHDPLASLWGQVPCIRLTEDGADPQRHTPLDVPSRLHPEELARAATYAQELVRLASSV